MLAELPKRFFGTVGAGREPVGPEADPREHRDQREPMEEPAISEVARRADDEPPPAGPARGRIELLRDGAGRRERTVGDAAACKGRERMP